MADAKLAAVIGHPVSHSLSPKLFSVLASSQGRQLSYGRIDVDPAELGRWYGTRSDRDGFVGWNVTIPHKEAILMMVDKVSAEATAVGAANVVHFGETGATAYNTDTVGIEATLDEQNCDLRGREVVLYGAGGAARAAAFVCGKFGAKRVVVLNRTILRAEKLCADFQAIYPNTRFEASGPTVPNATPACLINATSIGLKDSDSAFAFPAAFEPNALAFDLVYGADTPFVTQAAALGLRTVNGLDMLLWQAIATWKIWFGPLSDAAALKTKLAAELRKAEV